ncbi:MAG: ATP-binding protein [Huintestinicola sp.]
MSKKIFRSIISVAMVVLFASLLLAISFLYDYFNRSQVERLKEELSLVTTNVNEFGEEYFESFESSVFRLTLISSDGRVLHDSLADAGEMENHLDREEIAEALEQGKGSSARYSSTLTEKTFYEAVRLENGNVLRISINQVTVGALIVGMLPAICAIVLFSIIVALLMSMKMSESIVKPLNKLDLDNPTENDTYEELSPVLTKIHKQHKQIKMQMEELRNKNDEFNQIISSMNEGLILLDEDDRVISMNTSAKNIFGVTNDPAGEDFHVVDRTPEISSALQNAKCDNRTEINISKNGREYQLSISRIENDGKPVGTLILAFDITEKVFTERNRQEFTANVSHELKTPLQTIIGSAELLENGLVKPEDTNRFLANIKNEAARLVSLINDIIRLSQLDEKGEPIKEAVELYAVAGEVTEVLLPAAEKKNISLTLGGEKIEVNGIRRYLYEIIYNLSDNAIRYTEAGGRVDVHIGKENGFAVITVSDNGIGIPPEHQPRIFERFYRVDKSHSRETGGTGLGLSIVKRAAMLHNGKVELNSIVGKGTTIKVILPI